MPKQNACQACTSFMGGTGMRACCLLPTPPAEALSMYARSRSNSPTTPPCHVNDGPVRRRLADTDAAAAAVARLGAARLAALLRGATRTAGYLAASARTDRRYLRKEGW